MVNINTTEAPQRMLNYKTDTGADCLHVVSEAIRDGKPVIKNSTSALNEWNNTPAKLRHPHELPPGPGFPMYYTFKNLGDVTLSRDSHGSQVAVDTENGVYKNHIIGIETVAEREHQLGGGYMGYTEAMSGYTIDNNTVVLPYNQREVSIADSRIRGEATTTSDILAVLKVNDIVIVDGYDNKGQQADGTSNWYHTISPKAGWINAALIKGGLVMTNLKDMTPIASVINTGPNMDNGQSSTDPTIPSYPPTPITPVVTPPATGPVTTPVVTTPIESDPPVTIPVSTEPIIKIDPTQATSLGTDLGVVADASLTAAGRKKLYNIMTIINGVAVPVYGAGATAALFVGGTLGAEIAIGTGVLGVINSIVTAFTTKLASKNVTK